MSAQPDLHTHSTASDGSLAPADLVARAARAGVEVMALTDHDTTAGIAEAAEAARAHGLVLVPGVELSVTWGGRTVHIVGLGIDRANAALQAGLARIADYRRERAEEIARRLSVAGVRDPLAGAARIAGGAPIGRTHFARHLVELGYASDVRTIFKHYLTKGKPGHVAGEWVSLEEGVGWIRTAGGQAVIAHPARYGFTRTKLLRFIGEFKEHGGVGIEVVSGSHGRDDVFVFARHAREQSLLASAGSDYHGPVSPWVELGRLEPLPGVCTPIWSHAPWSPAAQQGPVRAASA